MKLFCVIPIECIILRVNPNVNNGSCVIMMCQYKFISCNKCNSMVRDVNNGGGCLHVWGQGELGTLYLSLNFSVILRVLFKK